jgi:alkylhydroperoxidase family enzyme
VNRVGIKHRQPAGAKGAARVEVAVLGPRGKSDPRLRRTVLEQAAWCAGRETSPANEVPEALLTTVVKVARHAYRMTDEDIDAAGEAGYDENELFDVIVAAALGAGLARRERGLAAISAWEAAAP